MRRGIWRRVEDTARVVMRLYILSEEPGVGERGRTTLRQEFGERMCIASSMLLRLVRLVQLVTFRCWEGCIVV